MLEAANDAVDALLAAKEESQHENQEIAAEVDTGVAKDFEVVRIENVVISDSSGGGPYDSSDYIKFGKPLIIAIPSLQSFYTDCELVDIGKRLGIDVLNSIARQ